jgi:hypothetical protein
MLAKEGFISNREMGMGKQLGQSGGEAEESPGEGSSAL